MYLLFHYTVLSQPTVGVYLDNNGCEHSVLQILVCEKQKVNLSNCAKNIKVFN